MSGRDRRGFRRGWAAGRARIPAATRYRRTAVVAVCALFAGGLVAAASAQGYRASTLSVGSGQVWLSSTAVGQVVLVDGSTGDVAGKVTGFRVGQQLAVAQPGHDAVVADVAAGALSRVNAALLQIAPKDKRPLDPDTAVRVLVSGPRVQAVSAAGHYVGLDPRTLRPVTAIGAGPKVAVDTLTSDAAGQVWGLGGAGELLRLSGSTPLVRAGVATAAVSRLTTAAGRLALVDPARRRVTEFDSDGGEAAAACLPDGMRGGVAAGVSSRADRLLVAANDTHELVLVNLRADDCSRHIVLGAEPADFGAPVESDGRAFVPDRRSGRVFVVDLSTAEVIGRPVVLEGGAEHMELLAHDGLVFYNDPASERAGVVRLDGSPLPIAKYDRQAPDAGLDPGAGTRQAPPAPPRKNGPDADAKQELTIAAGSAVAGQPTGLTVKATDDRPLASATWSFGDGSATQTGLGLTHTWNLPDDYTVDVRATRASGELAFGSALVHVSQEATTPPGQPPSSPTSQPPSSPTSQPPSSPTVPPPPTSYLTVTIRDQGSSVRISPPGISCLGSCQKAFPVGTSVTLTAQVPMGQSPVFSASRAGGVSGLAGACGQSSLCAVTMTSDGVNVTLDTKPIADATPPRVTLPTNGQLNTASGTQQTTGTATTTDDESPVTSTVVRLTGQYTCHRTSSVDIGGGRSKTGQVSDGITRPIGVVVGSGQQSVSFGFKLKDYISCPAQYPDDASSGQLTATGSSGGGSSTASLSWSWGVL